MLVRYIRDQIHGNTSNNYNHWVEVEAYYGGTNVALFSPVTSSHSPNTSLPPTIITDGNKDSSGYWEQVFSADPQYVTIDLGSLYDIDIVKVWHYYIGGRSYHDNITSVSDDGVNWTVVFSSIDEGEYAETSAGHTINLPSGFLDKRYIIPPVAHSFSDVRDTPLALVSAFNDTRHTPAASIFNFTDTYAVGERPFSSAMFSDRRSITGGSFSVMKDIMAVEGAPQDTMVVRVL